jgi:filamentous hemagglutinin
MNTDQIIEALENWEYYDIHHIKPREFGGTNAFENLTPVERTVEHQKLNRFWEKY